MISSLNISSFAFDPFGRRILKISKPCNVGVPESDSLWTYTYYVNDASGNVMATYSYDKGATRHKMTLDEEMVYGSSRLGLRDRNKLLSTFTISGSVLTHTSADDTQRSLGEKRYEFTNHLGNVLLVTTDRKMSQDPNTDGVTDYYHAVVDAYYDYGPFGNILDGRKGGSSMFGFQGQEKDDELYGDNNSVNFAFRMHDPRLGRFLSVDPLAASFVHNSPYAFSENRVIDGIELEGMEVITKHFEKKNASISYNSSYLNISYSELQGKPLIDFFPVITSGNMEIDKDRAYTFVWIYDVNNPSSTSGQLYLQYGKWQIRMKEIIIPAVPAQWRWVDNFMNSRTPVSVNGSDVRGNGNGVPNANFINRAAANAQTNAIARANGNQLTGVTLTVYVGNNYTAGQIQSMLGIVRINTGVTPNIIRQNPGNWTAPDGSVLGNSDVYADYNGTYILNRVVNRGGMVMVSPAIPAIKFEIPIPEFNLGATGGEYSVEELKLPSNDPVIGWPEKR